MVIPVAIAVAVHIAELDRRGWTIRQVAVRHPVAVVHRTDQTPVVASACSSGANRPARCCAHYVFGANRVWFDDFCFWPEAGLAIDWPAGCALAWNVGWPLPEAERLAFWLRCWRIALATASAATMALQTGLAALDPAAPEPSGLGLILFMLSCVQHPGALRYCSVIRRVLLVLDENAGNLCRKSNIV